MTLQGATLRLEERRSREPGILVFRARRSDIVSINVVAGIVLTAGLVFGSQYLVAGVLIAIPALILVCYAGWQTCSIRLAIDANAGTYTFISHGYGQPVGNGSLQDFRGVSYGIGTRFDSQIRPMAVSIYRQDWRQPIVVASTLSLEYARETARSLAERSGLALLDPCEVIGPPPDGIALIEERGKTSVELPSGRRSQDVLVNIVLLVACPLIAIALFWSASAQLVVIAVIVAALTPVFAMRLWASRTMSRYVRVIESDHGMIRLYEKGPDGPINESMLSIYRAPHVLDVVMGLKWLRPIGTANEIKPSQIMWVRQWLFGQLSSHTPEEPPYPELQR